jgi:hypothetical protein
MPVAVVLMGHNNDSLVIAERNGGNDGRLPIPQAHNAHSENLADIGEKVRLMKSGSSATAGDSSAQVLPVVACLVCERAMEGGDSIGLQYHRPSRTHQLVLI